MTGRAGLLIVAGFDPSGSGIDADREAAVTADVRPYAVVTAETQQDDHGVHAVGERPARAWRDEAEALLCAGRVQAIKFGLLPGVQHVARAAELVRSLPETVAGPVPVVVDPVISASSGRRFLFAAAVDALANKLLREPVVVTPNLPEAAELTGAPLSLLMEEEEARLDAARLLLDKGCAAVILKGGHGSEDPVLDLLVQPDTDPVAIRRKRRPGPGIRGSGCRFASRLAAGLARGDSLEVSARAAGDWVAERIARATPHDA